MVTLLNGKPRKFYKVGEIMKHTGLSRQTVHNYTVMGLIKASERSEGGHRMYDEDVFERLQLIEAMKRHRTLTEIKEFMDQRYRAPTSPLAPAK
jgi:DNA-binding transcriptional MerR regulator